MRLFRPPSEPLTTAPYQRRYRQQLSDLLFRAYNTHSHLDWHDTSDWLDSDEGITRLAWRNGRLVGALAASQPLDGASWVRLAAVQDDFEAGIILEKLWSELKPLLTERGAHMAALLITRDWLTAYAPSLGFQYNEDIITLRRPPQPPPAQWGLRDDAGALLSIRPVDVRAEGEAILHTIQAVDNAAFTPPWQMSFADVRGAVRGSAVCTAAYLNDVMVGYQLCTLYFDGAHLARLAVHPNAQGMGVGAALLTEVLRGFAQRGVMAMTVNTQASNLRSQRLYQRFGFQRNGYDLPVWSMSLV